MSIQQPAMIRADPVADPAREPTLFERAGGLPALTRMARLFYEKLVPADPLLAPLFADMRPGHPEQVAARVGEVFGGFRSAFTSCIEWESRFAAEGPRRGAAPPQA